MERDGFLVWMKKLREAMVVLAGQSPEQAERWGSDEDWRMYFDDGYSPIDAVRADLSYAN